jgi:DNA-binding beta-propeller fold protein YncE
LLVSGLALTGGCGGDPVGPPPCRAGTICTWAGDGEPAFYGDGLDRRVASLFWPTDLAIAPDGRAYVLDWQNHRVRRVTGHDTFETVIGTDDIGDGPDEGDERVAPGVLGTKCHLNHPTDVAFAPDGAVVLAAWHNHKVRRLDPASGFVEVVSGKGPGFTGDGAGALAALLNQPKAVAVDAAGNIYVLDTRNHRIRRIDTSIPPVIATVAGNGTRGFAGDGGPALAAEFAFQKPTDNPEPGGGLSVDGDGRLYVVDTENHRVRRIDFAADRIDTVAGNGVAAFAGDGGAATDASLNYPRDAAIAGGRLYIADTDNHRVRAVDLATGVITTVAGDGQAGFGGDGKPPAEASLQRPWGIAIDAAGSLYIADTFNNRIRMVMP